MHVQPLDWVITHPFASRTFHSWYIWQNHLKSRYNVFNLLKVNVTSTESKRVTLTQFIWVELADIIFQLNPLHLFLSDPSICCDLKMFKLILTNWLFCIKQTKYIVFISSDWITAHSGCRNEVRRSSLPFIRCPLVA